MTPSPSPRPDFEPERLVVVGSGPRELWEPVLARLAQQHDLAVVDPAYPTWQGAYATKHRIADVTNRATVFHAVADLRGEVPDAGVVTWNQRSVVPVAEAARRLRMAFLPVDAATAATDSLEVRAGLAEDGVPGVPWRLVHTEDDLVEAGEWIGYPVVLRPRLRGGPPAAVALGEGDLREAFAALAAASPRGAVEDDGVVAEQFVPGEELNLVCAVQDGRPAPIGAAVSVFDGEHDLVCRGYEARPLSGVPHEDELAPLLDAVHRRLGIDRCVTTTRVRLSADGPRVIGLDTWLDGRLVASLYRSDPHRDPVAVAAGLALQRELTPAGT